MNLRSLRASFYRFAFLGVAVCVGCEQGGERPSLPGTTGGAGGESDSEVLGGSPPDRHEGSRDPGELSLPFAVDEHYVPFGYMGSPVTIFRDPNDCQERPEGAQGHCHAFRFLELPEPAWRGLYWLSEYDNWGKDAGRRIMPGATKVSFFAATDVKELKVYFLVGGVGSDSPPEEALEFKDTIDAEIEIVVTPELRKYTLAIPSVDYAAGVLGGFGWGVYTVEGGRLWLDDIRWE